MIDILNAKFEVITHTKNKIRNAKVNVAAVFVNEQNTNVNAQVNVSHFPHH